MDLTDFTAPERQAVLDLFVLGMYADGHIASSEEDQGRRLLGEMGFQSVHERSREFDAAVTRIRRHSLTAADTRTYAHTLALTFQGRTKRSRVYGLLAELMASDKELAMDESRFLSVLREVFELE